MCNSKLLPVFGVFHFPLQIQSISYSPVNHLCDCTHQQLVLRICLYRRQTAIVLLTCEDLSETLSTDTEL